MATKAQLDAAVKAVKEELGACEDITEARQLAWNIAAVAVHAAEEAAEAEAG